MKDLMRDFHAICDFGGRFAGSDGEAAACDWLEARLEQASGVAPSRFSVHFAGSPDLTALTSGFPALEAWLLERAAARGVRLGAHRPLMANSDHYNFARAGVPAARLVAGFDEPGSHLRYVLTPADTRDKVLAGDLVAAARLSAGLVEDACRAPDSRLR